MKIRILAGILIGVFLLLSLLFLPHGAIVCGYVCIVIFASAEMYSALTRNYTPIGDLLCTSEVFLLAFSLLFVAFLFDNYQLGYIIILCALVDTGGYAAGNIAGKKAHRVAFLKDISPKKSWEGYVAGIALSIGLGIAFYSLMRDVLPTDAFYFSFIAWLPAILGDLSESKIKRALGIKDSGEVLLNSKFRPFHILELPLSSHGGYLDRIDSFSFTILAYAIFVRFMP